MLAPIIVLDGVDSCGKSTQAEILVDTLKKNFNFKVGFLKFPSNKNFVCGKVIDYYLSGKFENHLSKKTISMLYAFDRLEQKNKIKELQKNCDFVIFDRGVSSNIIYTSAKEKSDKMKLYIKNYIENLEYNILQIPKESLVIILNATKKTSKFLQNKKTKQKDINEENIEYLEAVRNTALFFCDKMHSWERVDVQDCFKRIIDKRTISKKIINIFKEKILNKH